MKINQLPAINLTVDSEPLTRALREARIAVDSFEDLLIEVMCPSSGPTWVPLDEIYNWVHYNAEKIEGGLKITLRLGSGVNNPYC